MNHLLNITKKELKEMLTPGAILSIVLVVVLLSSIGLAVGGEVDSTSKPANVGIVYDGDYGEYIVSGSSCTVNDLVQSAYASTYGVSDASQYVTFMSAAYGDSASIISEMQSLGLSYVIAIPSTLVGNLNAGVTVGISSYYIYEDSGMFDSIGTSAATALISQMSSLTSYEIISANISGMDGSFVQSPLRSASDDTYTLINGTVYSGVTPSAISNATMNQSLFIPLVVMIVIVMVGSVVISSMGNEKENKTLETLLTMPIKRTTIVSGKLLAAAIVGAVYGICYLLGLMVYSNGITSGIGGSINLSDYGLSMDPVDWIILMVMLFLSIFAALGLCMILGAFTKNYKMAQTMTMPIAVLAIIPMFVLMFISWDSLPAIVQTVMFAIPFTHPMMAMDNLMFGNLTLVAAGIAYMVIFDIIMILLTVKIYNSDILITGLDQTKFMKKLKGLNRLGRDDHEDN